LHAEAASKACLIQQENVSALVAAALCIVVRALPAVWQRLCAHGVCVEYQAAGSRLPHANNNANLQHNGMMLMARLASGP
jgi:hypothetical protein